MMMANRPGPPVATWATSVRPFGEVDSPSSPTHDDESLPSSPTPFTPRKDDVESGVNGRGASTGGRQPWSDEDDDESLPPSPPPHDSPQHAAWDEPETASVPLRAPIAAWDTPAPRSNGAPPPVVTSVRTTTSETAYKPPAPAAPVPAAPSARQTDDIEEINIDEVLPVPKLKSDHIELDEEFGTADLGARSPSYTKARESHMPAPESNDSQHKALNMWKGLQEHVKAMEGRTLRVGCTWYVNVVHGKALVSYVQEYLHNREEAKYKEATRQQATGIAQMLADQAMLIPANDIARDGVSDSKYCIFYISGVALDGAVGLAG